MNHYKLYMVLFSWRIFRIFPSKWTLSERDDRYEGFAVDWLGFEFCFEGMVPRGCGLATKSEILKDRKVV